MKQLNRGKLVVLHVSGVSPERMAEIIAPTVRFGEKEVSRIFMAEGGGILVSIGDADPGGAAELKTLIDKLGQDRVVDASQVRPNELVKRKLTAG